MSTVIGVMGESGSGKTTAYRTCDIKSTYVIDCDKKGLSWKGWKKQYNEESKNYKKTSDPIMVKSVLRSINEKAPHIKAVIIDTVNGIMIDDEMKRFKEKGFDKWQDLAISVYDLISECHTYREDLVIVLLFHVQDNVDDLGNHHYHILTSGRKLEKIKLETKLTTVLFAKGNEGKYFFETQAKNSTAKSPIGLFDQIEIPNDLNMVINSIKKYEGNE